MTTINETLITLFQTLFRVHYIYLLMQYLTIIIRGRSNECSYITHKEVQFSSVAQLCPTLWDLVDCSTPGFPVHCQPQELAQTRIFWADDAIQTPHPLLYPSPPSFNLSSIRVFSNESVLCIRWPNYWSFSVSMSPSNEYSGLIFL